VNSCIAPIDTAPTNTDRIEPRRVGDGVTCGSIAVSYGDHGVGDERFADVVDVLPIDNRAEEEDVSMSLGGGSSARLESSPSCERGCKP